MIEIRPNPDVQAGYARLDQILSDHAEEQGEPFTMTEMCLEAYDGGRFLGGISAKLGRQWVFVELLAIAPDARGRGIGRRLINAIEARALDMAKVGVWLDTYSFQAPVFYEKLGYIECGRIPDYPLGHDRRFYAKRLDGTQVKKVNK